MAFVEKQYKSIINQLGKHDEFIISDDGSTDETVKILKELSHADERVIIEKGPCKGVIQNFASAIMKCKGDIIFISDQDDIWYEDKIRIMTQVFKNHGAGVLLVMHDGIESSKEGIILKNSYPMHHGIIRNIAKSSYYGHRMAFRRELVSQILPFPRECPAYDQYIGLIGEKLKASIFIEDKLTNHIITGNNYSKSLPFLQKIIFRLNLLRSCKKFILFGIKKNESK